MSRGSSTGGASLAVLMIVTMWSRRQDHDQNADLEGYPSVEELGHCRDVTDSIRRGRREFCKYHECGAMPGNISYIFASGRKLLVLQHPVQLSTG